MACTYFDFKLLTPFILRPIIWVSLLFYLVSCGGDNTPSPSTTLPGPVVGLAVSVPSYDGAADKGGFTVSWAAPTDTGISADGTDAAITGYEVAYAVVSNDVVGKYTSATREGTATTHVFTNLTPHTQYDIRIRVQTAAGLGPENRISGWTPSLPGVIDPGSILLTNATSSTIQIRWTAPQTGQAGGTSLSDATTLYKVEIAPVGSDTYILVKNDYSGITITATGLSNSTEYHARITAKNVWGEAEASVSTNTKTTLATGATPPPENLRQVNTCAKATSVDLAWDPVSTATSYQLYRDDSLIEKNITTKTYSDTGLALGSTYNYKVKACRNAICSDNFASLTITTLTDTVLKSIIDCGRIPEDLTDYDDRSQEIFSRYPGDVPLAAKYLKPGGTGDGSSFANAAGNLRDVLEGITDASTDKVYAVFLIGGNYKAGAEMAMKNHVAIIGGMNESLEFSDTATELDGEGSYRVFYNNYNKLTNTALLYRVIVTNGNAVNSGGSGGSGGGMLNDDSSPSLVGITFSGNTADWGGGMYNSSSSSPSLEGVVFSSNTASTAGGGMYNDNSSPSLVAVTFSGNTTDWDGGGMYNFSSSPSLEEVTFSGNRADRWGGGMVNFNSSPSLVRVTFSENKADWDRGFRLSHGYGGGMYNSSSSSPSLEGVVFSSNTASTAGGGMYNDNSSPSLVRVTFSGNRADRWGGGMYNSNSTPSLVGATFSENTANDGGGMVNDNSSPSLEEVTFSGNTAKDGGGMVNRDSSPILKGVAFSSNKAGWGGGMHNDNSFPTLMGVTFSENIADDDGGGMVNRYSSPILKGVTFSGNTADDDGGGMVNRYSSPSLEEVTFYNNTAPSSHGGGMYNDNSSPILKGVTLSENTATYGGGMYNFSSSFLIINGIFWGNTAGSGPQFLFENTGNQENLRIYNSIVEGGTGNLVSGATYTNVNQGGFVSDGGSAPVVISFSNIITNDPGLGELANNGGSVLTHAILSNSPAVNQGLYVKKSGDTLYYSDDNTDWYTSPALSGEKVTVPAGAEDLTATDATGYKRTNRPDLGAYEYR